MAILWILLSLASFLFIRYQWYRRRLYYAAWSLNGPISLPIIGSTFPFIFCKTEDLLQQIYQIVNKYDNPIGFWLGPELTVVFKEPRHLEKIMCSSKFSHKHKIYDLMKVFLGEGLITASGQTYKLHKKMIQPLFSLEFSTECVGVFERHMKMCVDKLEGLVGRKYFNIEEVIHKCTADIIGDVVLGYSFESQKGNNVDYTEGFTEVYKIAFARMAKPWLHPNLIFRFSKLGKNLQKICDLSNKLKDEVFAKYSERQKRSKKLVVEPIVDKIARCVKENPGLVSREEFWFHLISLYMASQDTVALIASAACLCFGMYPEYQEKVVREMRSVLGKDIQTLNVEDLTKLPFLDMCVKDVLRLFPIGPYIFRKNLENQHIDKWFLPKDCGIGIPIYNLHRNPTYWKNPDHFYPDHFLPAAEQSRPSFAYIPFSAGPRGCIGKVFANISVKVILIHLLQNFEIEAHGKLPSVKFTMDISTRSLNGYMVKIKRRSN
ncbi:hypothetical protein Zmor_000303 [Zophobas morio]|uniref:Cytochrome P450 n=1 Tax=Zophobas morio TaxID=2755281 RepID=A0AA38IZU5_9CUCU|nr:hypothetical protein Zmor_000303 [Zophobas morio]